MRPGQVQIRPLGGWPGCLLMILFSVIASVVGTVLLNLLLRLTQGHPPSRPIVGNDRRQEMGTATKRRERQLALVTVAAPIAGSALEQTARRAEAGDQTSPTSRRLRQSADLVQRLGRGPLADRLRQWLADGHGRSAGFAASLRQRPPGHTAAQSPRVRAFGAPGAILGAEGWFTEWHEGQPASVGTANPRRPAADQPYSARPHLL